MTLEEYTKAVRKEFPVGAKPLKEVDAYFKEKDTMDIIKDNYEYYTKEKMAGTDPAAVANCLDLLY